MTGNTLPSPGNALPAQFAAAPPIVLFAGQPTTTQVCATLVTAGLWVVGVYLTKRSSQT
ncbi:MULTISPECIES: hypothetical protein [unclassified Streptomyces]|uniref:hypothetical protein n=1 Tax=unclassified Streptomyces TaxID=2593676 RepID=UPI0037F9556B